MKKTFFFLLTLMLCVGMLAGCSQNGENKSEKITVYSFCGENEQFAVTNGVIVISADEEIFYGGDLKVTDDEYFSDITSYSVKFYTMTNGETRTIMHNSVVDQTGSTINVAGDLGIAAFTKHQDMSQDDLDEVQRMIDRIRKGGSQ